MDMLDDHIKRKIAESGSPNQLTDQKM